jgi:methylmalonyl-CoA/ethylmalonyl-CoA epimerase
VESLRFLHVGVAVPALEEARSLYETSLGCRLTAGPFEDPLQEARVCFLQPPGGAADRLELIAPLGAGSRVNAFIAKGLGGYHLCFEAVSFDQTLSELRARGFVLFHPPAPAVAFGGRRIAWLYTPIRQLLEIVEA